MQVNCIIRDRMRMVLWIAMIRSMCECGYEDGGVTRNGCRSREAKTSGRP